MQQLGWPAWGMAGSQGPRRLAWRGAAWGVCTFRAISLHPGIRWRHGRWRWNPCITTVLMGGLGPETRFLARAQSALLAPTPWTHSGGWEWLTCNGQQLEEDEGCWAWCQRSRCRSENCSHCTVGMDTGTHVGGRVGACQETLAHPL